MKSHSFLIGLSVLVQAFTVHALGVRQDLVASTSASSSSTDSLPQATSPATSTTLGSTPTSTCGVALQTSWEYVAPPLNGGKDYGAPYVKQGKAANGQPKSGGEYGKSRPRNLILIIPDGFG